MRFINYNKNLLIILMSGTYLGCCISGRFYESDTRALVSEVILFGAILGLGIYWMVTDLRR